MDLQIESQRKKFYVLLWFTVLAMDEYYKESESEVAQLYPFVTPQTVVHQAPLSEGFFRQEY